MGIYYVEAGNCKCKGCFTTYSHNSPPYITQYCEKHKLKEGNTIHYNLCPLLKYITNNMYFGTILFSYPIFIQEILQLSNKTLVKCTTTEKGLERVFESAKNQMYYSEFNDEPMYKKVSNDVYQFIFVYQKDYHTIANDDTWQNA